MRYKTSCILIMILSLAGLLVAGNPTTLDVPSTYQSKTPIDKGGFVFSGSAQITFGGGDLYNNQTQIAFQPSVLTFIVKRFAIGADVAIIYNNYDNDDELQLAVGPNFAFFMGSGDEKTLSFIEFSPRFTHKEFDMIANRYDDYTNYDSNSQSGIIWDNPWYVRRVELRGWQLAGSIGMTHLVGKKAAVTVATGFTYDILSKNDISLNGFYLGLKVGLAMFLY